MDTKGEKLPPPALAPAAAPPRRLSSVYKALALVAAITLVAVTNPLDAWRVGDARAPAYRVPPISNPHKRTVVLISIDGFRCTRARYYVTASSTAAGRTTSIRA